MSVTLLHYKPLPRSSSNQEEGEQSQSFFDLNGYCNISPTSTYFMRVEGNSMVGAGIHHDDVLLVDRSVGASHGDIVVASLPSGFTVKELSTFPSLSLIAHNPKYDPIYITSLSELEVFGVVVSVVRTLGRLRTKV